MNIQQIIEVLEDIQRSMDDIMLGAVSRKLTTAIRQLEALQQLEGMVATQEKSDWVLMPKHLTDAMVRAGVQRMLGHSELDDALSTRLSADMEALYQSLIEARPQ